MRHRLPTTRVLGVDIVSTTGHEALGVIERLHDEDAPALVAYANAHTLNLAASDPAYRDVLNDAAIVLNDGAGVAIAGRLQRRPFPENLNGSDLNPKILELAALRGWPVYLLGAHPGTAEAVAERYRDELDGLNVVGTRHGFFERSEDAAVAAEIAGSGATLLLVAMGNPLQEIWLARNLGATGARLGVGVGAFFDFAAGRAVRAPQWMNRAGIEWVWRLAREPRRLWRRYVLGNPVFVYRALKERLTASR